MTAAYRVRQFVQAVGSLAQREGDSVALLTYMLPPAAQVLFRAMARYDRRHALGVCRTLQQRGCTDPDLLAAALLHDVGKTAGSFGSMRLWHRVAVVLLRAFRPGLLEKIGRDAAASWRRPFFVQLHHAAIGAEVALRSGCSPRTAEWIRRHEELPLRTDDALLSALQAADSAN